jgi:hypothetical protein
LKSSRATVYIYNKFLHTFMFLLLFFLIHIHIQFRQIIVFIHFVVGSLLFH